MTDTFRPLTQTEKRQWQRLRQVRGRPRRDAGEVVISLTIDRELLNRCDRLARKRKLSRSELIARGTHAVLVIEDIE